MADPPTANPNDKKDESRKKRIETLSIMLKAYDSIS